MSNLSNSPESSVQLIVTRPPEGKVVHTELGIKTSGNYIDPYFKLLVTVGALEDVDKVLGGSFLNPRYIPATEVGLEWHRDGKKIPVSDKWARESYILISNEKNTVQEILGTH